MGGVLQMLLGVSRIGRFVAYTPHVVVSGFMSGIGIIVILMQTLPFLGMPTTAGRRLGGGAAHGRNWSDNHQLQRLRPGGSFTLA